MRRLHVLVRLLVLAALASVGCSSVYWLIYLVLPVLAALLLSRDGSEGYLGSDAPVAVRALRWFAGAYAYLWLLTDSLPTSDGSGPVQLSVAAGGHPTPGSALWRLMTSLPAILLLALMSVFAVVLWIVGALAIVATEQVPDVVRGFIEMKLRYQFRLAAYHLSLVDAYPIVTDSPAPHAPRADAA